MRIKSLKNIITFCGIMFLSLGQSSLFAKTIEELRKVYLNMLNKSLNQGRIQKVKSRLNQLLHIPHDACAKKQKMLEESKTKSMAIKMVAKFPLLANNKEIQALLQKIQSSIPPETSI